MVVAASQITVPEALFWWMWVCMMAQAAFIAIMVISLVMIVNDRWKRN